jgi:CYTH domain-containing protein
MPDEIERKFVIARWPAEASSLGQAEIEQGYLSGGEDEIRVRRIGAAFVLGVKRGRGLVRQEVELNLERAQFDRLWPLTEGRRIQKRRLTLDYLGHDVTLDVYSAALHGLMIAEVEFTDTAAAAAFIPPEWLGREVTGDERYTNAALAAGGLPEPAAIAEPAVMTAAPSS